nr:hypothetical protein [Tanacetum cinerariifolium]
MEFMLAYDATDNELPIPLLQTIIALPTALPLSSVSPMFDSQDSFLPRKFHLKTLRLLNHPLWTSTSEAPAMTQGAIKKLVTNSISTALEAQAANMENTDNTTEPRKTFVARKCTYKEFMSCQPFYFNAVVPNSEKLMKVFIGGLPRSIEGNVTASKPQTLEEAINVTQRLMDQLTKHNSVEETNDHKRKFDDSKNTNNKNYPNNRYHNNYPNDYNNNNHSNTHNNNNYQDNRKNKNRNNDHHQQQNRKQETFRT